jgi:hypothetical protein
MIPTIIYFLLRRYKRSNPAKAERLTLAIQKASRMLLLFILLILIGYFALPQDTQLQYTIKRKGSEIGIISFSQQNSGTKKVLKIESKIRTRILFLFTAIGQEESVFENGVMIWSTVYQKLNGSERVNKKTQLMGRNYVVTKGKESETISSYPISYNMVCLFAREPVSISKVYSDAFQRFLDIQTLGEHKYKITFPDGNYNEYHYSNGLCAKVEVHHRLYRSSFELKNN